MIEVTQQGYGDPTLATKYKARKWLMMVGVLLRAVFLVGSSFPSAWRSVSVRLLSTFAVSGSGGVLLYIVALAAGSVFGVRGGSNKVLVCDGLETPTW